MIPSQQAVNISSGLFYMRHTVKDISMDQGEIVIKLISKPIVESVNKMTGWGWDFFDRGDSFYFCWGDRS